jgi:hypothetical protein
MKICDRHQAKAKGSSGQTTRDDFCRIFTQDMKGLYLLSFLLTADPKKAEQCFAAGMEDCVEGNPVFKEWAHAWSRRAIIKNAIRIVAPLTSPTNAHELTIDAADWETDLRPALAAVTQLEPLERFVYVMSVLERYSDHECSTLLITTKGRVVAARTRGLQRLSVRDGINPSPAEVVGKLLSSESQVSFR